MKSQCPPKDKFKKSKEEQTFQEGMADTEKNPPPEIPKYPISKKKKSRMRHGSY